MVEVGGLSGAGVVLGHGVFSAIAGLVDGIKSTPRLVLILILSSCTQVSIGWNLRDVHMQYDTPSLACPHSQEFK